MPRALSVCPTPGCPNLSNGRCTECRAKAEQTRGSAAQRGYGGKHWRAQRRACLRRDPICTCTEVTHDGHGARCWQQSSVADHHPTSRRDLVAQGVADPDALVRLRGLCSSCHNRATAAAQPGGWHDRQSR